MIDHWIMFVVFGFELGSVQDALKKCFNQQYLGNSGLIYVDFNCTRYHWPTSYKRCCGD